MFETLGLCSEEEVVYLAIVDKPGTDLSALADSGVCPSATRSAIASLEARGLVAQLPGRPRRFTAAAPEVALEVLIRAHEEELQRIRVVAGQLGERHRQARAQSMGPDQVVEVVTTREATIQRLHEVQRSAQREVLTFDRPPYLTFGINDLERELLGKGAQYRCVYDRCALAVPERIDDVMEMASYGEQSRIATRLPVKMFIADENIGLVSLHGSSGADSALVVHASSLLDSLVALFEEVWRRAVPLSVAFEGPAARRDAHNIELAGLLAAGLTDDAIAHQRGINPRTVRRHIRTLMDELGVHTRFQAGLQSGRRGWL